MCHDSGAIASLFLLVILHGSRAIIAGAPTLQLLEQAATEQLNARRGAEHALVEAQTRSTQLDQALQQGGRHAQRPDKWWILLFSGGQTNGTEERKHGPIGAS